MKTVLQELIERLNEAIGKTSKYEQDSLKEVIELATELLVKEKEQIKDAFVIGLNSDQDGNEEEMCEQYFNQTFSK